MRLRLSSSQAADDELGSVGSGIYTTISGFAGDSTKSATRDRGRSGALR